MIGRILMVALGGSLGAVSRYAVTHFVNLAFPGTVVSHWGTLTVNLAGSFLIGILFSTVQGVPHFNHLWLFFAVGFMGAFTTFSSYALEMHNQLGAGMYKDAAINFLLNNIGAVFMVFAGIFLVKLIKG